MTLINWATLCATIVYTNKNNNENYCNYQNILNELFSATRKYENGIASNRKFRTVTVNMLSSFVHTARHTMEFFYFKIYN